MRKLEPADVLPLEEYRAARERFQVAVRAARVLRRVQVGERISLTFENRQTVLFQIQEMIRVEQLHNPVKIAEEVEVYNDLIADDGELRATFFVEITDRGRIRDNLDSLVGLETEGLYLVVDGDRIPAEFEPGHAREDRISAVHYVRFPLNAAQQAVLAASRGDARVVVEHPHYTAEAVLSPQTRAALVEDLAGVPVRE
jgi:TusA-related sulfurtransferase